MTIIDYNKALGYYRYSTDKNINVIGQRQSRSEQKR